MSAPIDSTAFYIIYLFFQYLAPKTSSLCYFVMFSFSLSFFFLQGVRDAAVELLHTLVSVHAEVILPSV